VPGAEPLRIEADSHPFVRNPHRTLIALSLPVLLSLVAEPLTGLVDTAFVARLGAVPLAALGVATVLLSSVFWIFNFLGIGTQTEVARAEGPGSACEPGCEVSGDGSRRSPGNLLVLLAWLARCAAALTGSGAMI